MLHYDTETLAYLQMDPWRVANNACFNKLLGILYANSITFFEYVKNSTINIQENCFAFQL